MSSSVSGGSTVASRKSTSSVQKRNRCCSWPVIFIAIVLLAVAGILIWQFAPIGQAVNAVVPGIASLVPTPSPGSSPTSGSAPAFQFNQCTTTDDCCNGLDTICDLGVNEVLFAGTHNSYASQDKGFLFFLGNQLTNVEDQMEAGFRGINLDLCGCSNSLVMCHNTCSVTRNANEVFTSMVSFLNDNPTEILLVTLELNPDMDQPVDLDNVYSEMDAVSGFVDYLYVHTDSTATWPTLRELKSSGKRMLIFHYRGPQCTSSDPCPDGLHYWFDYGFETSYEFESVDAITSDYSSSCSPDRGADGTKAFFGINHFTSIPMQDRATSLGTSSMLETRIQKCESLNSNQPVSVFYVDFGTTGSLLEVTQKHNSALARRRAA